MLSLFAHPCLPLSPNLAPSTPVFSKSVAFSLGLCPFLLGYCSPHSSLSGSLFSASLSPSLSVSLSPCPFLLCVRSSSGSPTARIQLPCIIWSPAHGASRPRTWWCQCWGGQGAPSSRPGCRTCCVAGWCGLPRAQVTEAGGWLCPLSLGPLPPTSLGWMRSPPSCEAILVFLSLPSFCPCTPVSLDLTVTLWVSVQGPGLSPGVCTGASAGTLVWLCATTRRPAPGVPRW